MLLAIVLWSTRGTRPKSTEMLMFLAFGDHILRFNMGRCRIFTKPGLGGLIIVCLIVMHLIRPNMAIRQLIVADPPRWQGVEPVSLISRLVA